MSDIEKAINYWKQFKKEIKKLRKIKPGAEWEEQEKATDLAISALEKQTPKKPLEQRYVNYEIKNELIGHRPACKLRWDVTYWQRHCSNCGQKLDWSVEE